MTAPRAADWWRTAPNPSCMPWCTETHQPTEFSNGGGLVCTRAITTSDWFAINLDRLASVYGKARGAMKVYGPSLSTDLSFDPEGRTPTELRQYATALLASADALEAEETRLVTGQDIEAQP